MTNQPFNKLQKATPKPVVLPAEQLAALQARWEESRRNQITVINRLQGIINLVGEIADSPSLSPEEALHKIKDILP